MKKLIFLYFIFSFQCFAQNTEIFKCHASNREWSSTFILDSVGTGFLKIKKANATYSCGLKLDFINDGQKSIVPKFKIEFILGACDPALGPLQAEILKSQTLIVDLKNLKKPMGRIQWLTKYQPDKCSVEIFKMFDMELGAKKWHEGGWGRAATTGTPRL